MSKNVIAARLIIDGEDFSSVTQRLEVTHDPGGLAVLRAELILDRITVTEDGTVHYHVSRS